MLIKCLMLINSIEKSFHNFRNLVNEFKAASSLEMADNHRRKGWAGVPESTQNMIALSDALSHVIDSEPISTYMGKVCFECVIKRASLVIFLCKCAHVQVPLLSSLDDFRQCQSIGIQTKENTRSCFASVN